MAAEPDIRAIPARLPGRFRVMPLLIGWLLSLVLPPNAAWAAPVAHRYGTYTFWVDVLENGLQAISVPDDTEPTATVFVIYSVGNRMEEDGTHGIAHLAEHAAFSGTPAAPMDVLIDTVESQGGEANAFTRDDMTVFYDHRIPTAMLAEVLEMEADRMRNVAFSDADFRHERARLEAEEQSTNDPRLQLRQWRRHAAFGGTTYGAGLFNAAGNSRAPGLDAAAVRAFYDNWYQPGRAAVVVVGPDPGAALPMVRAAFEDIPAPAAPMPHRVDIGRSLPTPGTVEFDTGLTRPRAERVWVGPGMDHLTDRLALEALALLHSGQPPTDRETREVFVDGMLGSSLFVVAVTGEDADSGAGQLAAQVTRDTLTEDALERAKAAMSASLSDRSVRTRPYFSLAVDFGLHSRWDLLGPLLEQDANVRALTVDDVKGAVSRWLRPEQAWTLRYHPDTAGLAALPSDKDALHAAGIAAAESGDLARAIAAFERLLSLTTDDMNTVIYRYTLGDLNFRLRRHGEARRHLEAGLAVIDYPALRELLEQVDAADGMGTPPPTKADADADPDGGADDAPATSVRVVDTTGATPAWATEAASVMGRLERWRDAPFKT
ncbi:MAG: insulinase family protein, partial [Myxococcota bacterium]|nr:insulinase family protein [Myxococcota bacterium]